MSIRDKLYDLAIDLKNKQTGQITTICPQCSESRKKKKDPCLSVDIDKGIYNCHHCGWHGKVFLSDEQNYNTPKINNTQLEDKALQWLVETRGLSKSTVMRFKLFSQDRKIGFPFYDENNELRHIKFRDGNKKFTSSIKTKLILFGMNLEHDFNRLIITEGELDAMSFYEVGHNAVSIPNGAGSHNWLDNCYLWVNKFKEILIAYDGDEKGIEGRNEIARRIGKEKCKIFRYPEGIKDANELLVNAKKESNWKDIFNAYFKYIEPFPIDGIIEPYDLLEKIYDLRKTGFPKGEKTGFTKLDNLVSFAPGQLTIVTGIPSHGKSEFIDQLIIRLKNMKCLIFSPENMPYEYHLSKLMEKALNKPFFELTNKEISETLDQLNNYFLFFDIEKSKSIDEIVSLCKQCVLSKGIKLLVIDPYSRLEHKYIGKMTETEAVREILSKLSEMAKSLGLHVILVAHPKKMDKDDNGDFKVPNLYSISGSAHFFNAADVGMTIYRRPMGDNEPDRTEIHVNKIRFKWIGQLGVQEFNWQRETGIYTEFN